MLCNSNVSNLGREGAVSLFFDSPVFMDSKLLFVFVFIVRDLSMRALALTLFTVHGQGHGLGHREGHRDCGV